jgi:D-alanyl-D-alanine carboxypeptidase
MTEASQGDGQHTGQPPPPPRQVLTWRSMRRRETVGVHRARSTRIVVAGFLAIGAMVCSATQASVVQAAPAGHHRSNLVEALHDDLESYLAERGSAEHVSAAALSVSLPGHQSTIDVSAGTTGFSGGQPVRTNSIWQIGSNTKAFTSVLLLQLEAEGRLSIDDTVGQWLPQYPQWRTVTIKRLLNMTSGIPTYDAEPAFLAAYAAGRYRYFSKEQLVDYVVDAAPTTGYSYSNTNYILAEMIIEKASGESYQRQLYTRLITPLGLRDTHYRPHLYPGRVTSREPASYFFLDAVPELSKLLGRDVRRDTLSWGRGAGGILSTTHDMTVWERALYTGQLLPPKQQAELFSLVSTTTGQPIDRTSPADPAGFGLGVQQSTGARFGTIWSYQGGTFGVRALHVYFPDSGLVIAVNLNSQPTENRINALAVSVYETLVAHNVIRPTLAPTAS